jgi:hypothetical protein
MGRVSAAAAGMTLFPELPTTAAPAGGQASNRQTAEPPKHSSTEGWLARWEQNILRSARKRYCDTETGEQIGWLMSPFLEGFYHGYKVTRDLKWLVHSVDWAESWFKRVVNEPDGFPGWPKRGTGGRNAAEFLSDSLLGEAMGLRPLVLLAGIIDKTPALKERFGEPAQKWLATSARVFEKWDSRGCWREVADGGVWVVPAFGIDTDTGKWTEGYERREVDGFSNPANKQNHIARWLLAMHEVAGNAIYRERAEKWFKRMKSCVKTRENGKYAVWNYWDPAGPWDYKPDGSPRHWVGVHPNGGYYSIDVAGMVAGYEHNLVFTREDIQRLIATNRDYMWNQKIEGAQFRRIDGGAPDARWKNSPGVLWSALAAYDETLRKIFIANHNPESWGALAATPWFIEREAGR